MFFSIYLKMKSLWKIMKLRWSRISFYSVFYDLFVNSGWISEAVAQKCSVKKGVLKNLAKFIGKLLCWSFVSNKIQVFLIKVAGCFVKLFFSLKRDSNTGVFLWILLSFYEHLFYRTLQVESRAQNEFWFFLGKQILRFIVTKY